MGCEGAVGLLPSTVEDGSPFLHRHLHHIQGRGRWHSSRQQRLRATTSPGDLTLVAPRRNQLNLALYGTDQSGAAASVRRPELVRAKHSIKDLFRPLDIASFPERGGGGGGEGGTARGGSTGLGAPPHLLFRTERPLPEGLPGGPVEPVRNAVVCYKLLRDLPRTRPGPPLALPSRPPSERAAGIGHPRTGGHCPPPRAECGTQRAAVRGIKRFEP